jgi:HAD superfamily hydrolase (TIGR01484 family)
MSGLGGDGIAAKDTGAGLSNKGWRLVLFDYADQVKPLSALSRDEALGLSGLLFDLDDTLLDHGRLTPHAFEALHALDSAGLVLVCVTGRPLAWGHTLLRQWPISGMVTENGNIAVTMQSGRLTMLDRLGVAERRQQRARLLDLGEQIRERWPELHESDDGFGRWSDIAFDVAEHATVEPKVVREAIDFAESHGARTSVSSIHMHVTFDVDDKATGALRYLATVLGLDPTRSRRTFAFVGDSENDRAAFAAFDTTIGVQNLRGRLTKPPRYLTTKARGLGFAEAARHLLDLRA